ncbi:MAG TPA: hypothetical protein VLF91_04155 [Candidatus Saccharimonadales bacterium]|nr:hypothetical protein [Candidatus Saccharimonadales bacterium]
MPKLPSPTIRLITALQNAGVDSILYGSQGVSLYLGAFKEFGDIDLLVDNRWVLKDWQELITIMSGLSFALQDEHEHEFINADNIHVAFADKEILKRDGIAQSLDDILETFTIGNSKICTLKPELFKKAYEFSERDGYRKDVRGKKDREVITRLSEYLERGSKPAS